jgi:death-on-curing protein
VEPIFLSLDDVLESHAEQIATYGGSDGIRDLNLLQSALAQPMATFDGSHLHADLFEMASAYLFHIELNHPFVDGNKRVGLEAALVSGNQWLVGTSAGRGNRRSRPQNCPGPGDQA